MIVYMKKLLISLSVLLLIIIAFGFFAFIPVEVDPDLILKSEEYYRKYKDSFPNDTFIVIDYRLSVFRKRLWLINRNTKEVILNSHVSHSWKSGTFVPIDFSNEPGSKKHVLAYLQRRKVIMVTLVIV